jgi:gliding motility-associated-like protein
VHITIRPNPVFSIGNPASICVGENIQLTAAGGDVYDWQPATGLSDNTIANPVATPLATTTYSVLITESACLRSQTLSVTIDVEVPQVRTINDLTICRGSSIQLTTTGAQSYSWTPAGTLDNAAIANPVATPTVPTQYIVTGITPGGCTGKDTVNVNLHPVPVITITDDTEICANTSIQLSVSGGQTYQWSPAATLDDPASATPIATPTASTWYYVNITDNNLCPVRDSVLISIRPLPVFSATPSAAVCIGESVQLSASGGVTYDWQPATGLSNNTIANPVATPSGTTIYNVTITEPVCSQSQTLTVPVTVNALPNVVANRSNDIDCSYDRSQLTASGAVQYEWTPTATLSNPAIFNPVATPVTTTDYTVKGTDANGCENISTVTVKVAPGADGLYLMASGFTPNGDGKNDCYGIRFWGLIQEVEFSIYNRWGERIFYSTNPRACWDGTFKGTKQDSGVFVYVIKAKTMCAPSVFRKGTFVLIR